MFGIVAVVNIYPDKYEPERAEYISEAEERYLREQCYGKDNQ